MPELPEVETIKRILDRDIVGLTIKDVRVIYPRLVRTDLKDFTSMLPGKKIISLGRRGKFLIIHLSDDLAWLVHFRMEGKFFHLPELGPNLNGHVTMYAAMTDGTYMIFNDVRKFAAMYLYKEEELSASKPLKELGLEPWDIKSPDYLLKAYAHKNYMMKEAMLDQSVISGLGNIYADEVLFASGISPFRPASGMTSDEAQRVIDSSRSILEEAILNGGSTIRTYHPAQGVSGEMQLNLRAYGREGKPCLVCGTRMEKRYVGGRGTTYCPHCQHVYPSIAVTGKIATGKSQVIAILSEIGCYTASADKIVHELYDDTRFIEALGKRFPQVFADGALSKSNVIRQMLADRRFRRSYELFIWSAVKDKVNEFLIRHADYYAAVEVPLLFDAKMENDFTYCVGVESNKQREYLSSRSEEHIDERLSMNKRVSYDLNRAKLDFVIDNNGTRGSLESQVKYIFSTIADKYFGTCKKGA